MRALICGAAGQLGAVLVQRFREGGHDVIAARREDLDITSVEDVARVTDGVRPDVIVNCAAFNDVDGAESQYETALDVNAFAVRALARAARTHGALLVHYSTDFVFDGETDRPYSEEDPPRPLSVYASSKFLGEGFARDAERHYVLRVESLFGGPAARSSIDRIIEALGAGREARAFEDRIVSPSYVEDVGEATLQLLDNQAAFGLYHCVNGGYTTWANLASHVARLIGADSRLVVPVTVASVKLKAPRPRFAALDNRKLAAAGIRMPPWQDAIARYLTLRASRLQRA